MKIRETIKNFKPYEWEVSLLEMAKKLGLDPTKILRFDMNTMALTPNKFIQELEKILPTIRINEYPETSYLELRNALSKYTGRDVDEITVTAGCDEALDIVAKVFIDPGTKVLVSSPTYAMYRVVVEAMGGKIVNVLRRENFDDDVDGILKSIDDKTGLIFLCSPNNPTAILTSRETIVKLLNETECPIVVDESYMEFCGQTFVDLVGNYENLIILRTFSKAFSLAGARVGYVIANKNTINLLNIMRPPNSLSVISLALAKIALENVNQVMENVKKTIEEREKLIEELKKIDGLHVYPSNTNFVLVRFENGNIKEVHQKLLENGIITRNVSDQPLLENCLRITVRTQEENRLLVDTLKKILG
ncbi:histidinol-phosphate transaminase [Candidatus Bathyarchaeota archaeon]|nr:MAG: histidinol-phosphate transaminase [Candidatus Bathyarchaeota archaeon]